MDKKSMTALVSAFARGYHAKTNEVKVFDDHIIEKLLTQEEHGGMCHHMAQGVGFFDPGFVGDAEEALKWVMDYQLSPTPIGRAAYAEDLLKNAVLTGTNQYLLLGAGYDTFSLRQPKWAEGIEVFEVDHPLTQVDKINRIEESGLETPGNVHYVGADFNKKEWMSVLELLPAFNVKEKTYCSLLGVVYYLTEQNFENLLLVLSELLPKGSSIVFDYPDELYFTEHAEVRVKKQLALAAATGEQMMVGYSYRHLEQLLENAGFLIYEHLKSEDMTSRYFKTFNDKRPTSKVEAFENVNYCLAVLK